MRKSRKVRMWALALVLAMAIQLPVFAEEVRHDTVSYTHLTLPTKA